MIPEYSLRILFPKSRSKNFPQAIRLAKEFSDFTIGDVNKVNITMKEVFEKWEYFNLLFWRTVDWKGTVLEWEGMAFHSHTDKTRIFYALQHAHVSFICFLEDKLRELYRVHLGEIEYKDLDNVYTEDDMNTLIETYKILKQQKDVNSDEAFNNITQRERPRFLQNQKQWRE